jgi:REP element-mobilizing transposase RayT
VEAFAADEIATIHVMNRVVRRCFLMGTDEFSGKNYDHRKTWVESELKRLAAGFGIDLLTFSILSNHFHLILSSDRGSPIHIRSVTTQGDYRSC